jgi:hypothetical protein
MMDYRGIGWPSDGMVAPQNLNFPATRTPALHRYAVRIVIIFRRPYHQESSTVTRNFKQSMNFAETLTALS